MGGSDWGYCVNLDLVLLQWLYRWLSEGHSLEELCDDEGV